MKINWQLLLDDDSRFPRTVYFEEPSTYRFRYGINSDLKCCLYVHLPPEKNKEPIVPILMENISLEEMSKDGNNTLVLTLLNENARSLFSDFIANIVSEAKHYSDEKLKKGFIDLCYNWFELFDPVSSLLSKSEIQGLFGELTFLKYLLENSTLDSNTILSGWKGPYGKGHDFELDNNHFEVKGLSTGKSIVNISSEYQLDYLSGQTVILLIYELHLTEHIGNSIFDVVNDIVSILRAKSQGPSIKKLWTALRKVGITNYNIIEFNSFRFTIKDQIQFNCSNTQFPSIKRSTIPDEIKNVNYELSINTLSNFRIEDLRLFL